MFRIAFYQNDPAFSHKLVRFLTNSPFSHCELVFSDDLCFSSEPVQGTRFMRDSELYNCDMYSILELPWITEDQESKIFNFCRQEEHLNYDWAGVILGRINPTYSHDTKWFCSEICTAAIRPFTLGISDFWYTPGSLYRALLDVHVFNV